MKILLRQGQCSGLLYRFLLHRYRLHQKELDRIRDADKRHRRLVELNVIEQCINVYKTGIVQRRRVETYQAGQQYTTPRIHGLVFDPKVGRLERLNVSAPAKSRGFNASVYGARWPNILFVLLISDS